MSSVSSTSAASISASGTQAACASGSITVKASHPRGGGLADLDRDIDTLGEVYVDPRAEADETDPLTLFDLRACGT